MKRKRFQISMRSLLLVTLLASLAISTALWLLGILRKEPLKYPETDAAQSLERRGWVVGWRRDSVESLSTESVPARLPREIHALSSLREIDLSSCHLSDQFLAGLVRIDTLERIILDGAQFSPGSVRLLVGLPRLRYLSLRNSSLDGEGMRHVFRCRALEQLDISETSIVDSESLGLSDLQNLQKLRADECGLPDDRLGKVFAQEVAQLKKLRELRIRQSEVTDDEMSAIAELGQLEVLDLSRDVARLLYGKQAPSDLPFLDACPRLREFYVDNTRVSPAAVQRISTLAKLHRLSLLHVDIADQSWQCLQTLANLRYLACSPQSDDAIRFIGGISNVEELRFEMGGITDDGLPELRRMKRLRQVFVNATAVTDVGAKRLEREHGRVKVRFGNVAAGSKPFGS